MHAALRSVDSPDFGSDTLETYQPSIADNFSVVLGAVVGPDSAPGDDVFYVTVCTPKSLADSVLVAPGKGFEFLRHRLVVDHWDGALIRRAISGLCSRTEGSTWSEVATNLSRFMAWEFEGFRPD
jgi:Immunity protein 8